ncbi:ion channel [Colwellia sp. MEBiC06753]
MNETTKLCQYTDFTGCHCQEPDIGNGLCYWHDQEIDKSGDDVKKKLEAYAQSGGLLRGISLKYANLANINLVNHHQKQGYDFTYADFYKANLEGAHLFNIKLNHGSLMKADLRLANLNCASLIETNLLGVRWSESKIENIKVGRKVLQEHRANKAEKAHHKAQAIDYYEQAEEVYRDLRKHAEHEGIFTLSGWLIQKELTMRRMQQPKYSVKRFNSKVVDLFCGYGEAPLRIIGISIAMIILCALLYAITGLNYRGEVQMFKASASLLDNMSLFFSCLYYSVVTFTTLGYGDFTPIGISRAIAAFEAFTGSFTIALFVVVFVKKMTR